MKKISRHKLLTMILTLVGSAMLSMTAMADETTGALTSADDSGIRGWAWNKGSYDETVDVELHIYKDNSKDTVKVITVPANSYNADVSKSIGDGYHAFESKVNWSELGGTSYKIEAYAIAGEEKTLLPDPIEYKPTSSFSSEKSGKRDVSGGPGVVIPRENLWESSQLLLTVTAASVPGVMDLPIPAQYPRQIIHYPPIYPYSLWEPRL
jgi:hypothetical protein